MIAYIFGLVVAIALGFGWREVWELTKKVKALQQKPAPKTGVTMGSYSVAPKETPPTRSVVTPKSPQQLEFERQQKAFQQDLIERATHPYGDN